MSRTVEFHIHPILTFASIKASVTVPILEYEITHTADVRRAGFLNDHVVEQHLAVSVRRVSLGTIGAEKERELGFSCRSRRSDELGADTPPLKIAPGAIGSRIGCCGPCLHIREVSDAISTIEKVRVGRITEVHLQKSSRTAPIGGIDVQMIKGCPIISHGIGFTRSDRNLPGLCCPRGSASGQTDISSTQIKEAAAIGRPGRIVNPSTQINAPASSKIVPAIDKTIPRNARRASKGVREACRRCLGILKARVKGQVHPVTKAKTEIHGEIRTGICGTWGCAIVPGIVLPDFSRRGFCTDSQSEIRAADAIRRWVGLVDTIFIPVIVATIVSPITDEGEVAIEWPSTSELTGGDPQIISAWICIDLVKACGICAGGTAYNIGGIQKLNNHIAHAFTRVEAAIVISIQPHEIPHSGSASHCNRIIFHLTTKSTRARECRRCSTFSKTDAQVFGASRCASRWRQRERAGA